MVSLTPIHQEVSLLSVDENEYVVSNDRNISAIKDDIPDELHSFESYNKESQLIIIKEIFYRLLKNHYGSILVKVIKSEKQSSDNKVFKEIIPKYEHISDLNKYLSNNSISEKFVAECIKIISYYSHALSNNSHNHAITAEIIKFTIELHSISLQGANDFFNELHDSVSSKDTYRHWANNVATWYKLYGLDKVWEDNDDKGWEHKRSDPLGLHQPDPDQEVVYLDMGSGHYMTDPPAEMV